MKTKPAVPQQAFPPVECAGIFTHTFTEADYKEQLCFARTCEVELRRELEIVRIEIPAIFPTIANSRWFDGMVETIAHVRVWARFKNGDDRNRRFTPDLVPIPAGGATRKTLEHT